MISCYNNVVVIFTKRISSRGSVQTFSFVYITRIVSGRFVVRTCSVTTALGSFKLFVRIYYIAIERIGIIIVIIIKKNHVLAIVYHIYSVSEGKNVIVRQTFGKNTIITTRAFTPKRL